jgi:hypothetical protein
LESLIKEQRPAQRVAQEPTNSLSLCGTFYWGVHPGPDLFHTFVCEKSEKGGCE